MSGQTPRKQPATYVDGLRVAERIVKERVDYYEAADRGWEFPEDVPQAPGEVEDILRRIRAAIRHAQRQVRKGVQR